MLRFLAPYLISALIGGGGIWWVMDLRADLAAERDDNDRLRGRLATCSARVDNLIEDGASDAEIDRIPDADLRDVPERWLFKPPAR